MLDAEVYGWVLVLWLTMLSDSSSVVVMIGLQWSLLVIVT